MSDTAPPSIQPGVIAVIRTGSAKTALTVARGLAQVGVAGIEVTMTVPDAIEVIATLVAEGIDRIGAGTVRTIAQVHGCVDAGAQFLVSPHLNPELVTAGVARGVPVVPGALTPTEIMNAMELGASAVKVFPVTSVGGISFIQSVLEPIPDARIVASGEVTGAEVDSYLAAGAWAACLGSSLWPAEDAARGDVDAVAAFAEEALAQVVAANPMPSTASAR